MKQTGSDKRMPTAELTEKAEAYTASEYVEDLKELNENILRRTLAGGDFYSLLREKDMTLPRLAHLLGISPDSLHDAIREHFRNRREMLMEISVVLALPPDACDRLLQRYGSNAQALNPDGDGTDKAYFHVLQSPEKCLKKHPRAVTKNEAGEEQYERIRDWIRRYYGRIIGDINEYLRQRGITREMLADRMGVGAGTAGKYISSRFSGDREAALEAAAAMELTIPEADDFLNFYVHTARLTAMENETDLMYIRYLDRGREDGRTCPRLMMNGKRERMRDYVRRLYGSRAPKAGAVPAPSHTAPPAKAHTTSELIDLIAAAPPHDERPAAFLMLAEKWAEDSLLSAYRKPNSGNTRLFRTLIDDAFGPGHETLGGKDSNKWRNSVRTRIMDAPEPKNGRLPEPDLRICQLRQTAEADSELTSLCQRFINKQSQPQRDEIIRFAMHMNMPPDMTMRDGRTENGCNALLKALGHEPLNAGTLYETALIISWNNLYTEVIPDQFGPWGYIEDGDSVHIYRLPREDVFVRGDESLFLYDLQLLLSVRTEEAFKKLISAGDPGLKEEAEALEPPAWFLSPKARLQRAGWLHAPADGLEKEDTE